MNTFESKKRIFVGNYLRKLGFDDISIKLFLALAETGPLSILNASRQAGIERTKIYRIADNLVKKGLIEEVVEDKKRILQAANIHNIELLVSEQELNTNYLKASLPTFTNSLQTILPNQSPTSKVLFYRGKEGIKQMLWNELNTEEIGYTYVYKIFEMFVGERFFVKWVEEYLRKNVEYLELRTEIFDQSFEESPKRLDFQINGRNIRYISSKDFPMTHSMSIYNDVVAIYNWWNGEIFGTEIYNQQVADMQRIFFKTFWEKAKVKKDDRPTYYFWIK